jgi:hypothetical protein
MHEAETDPAHNLLLMTFRERIGLAEQVAVALKRLSA